MRMVPLRRNRDFVLLETGRLLSSAGTPLTTIAYPRLVAVFTACGLMLAVWGTLSPSIREAPSLDELSS